MRDVRFEALAGDEPGLAVVDEIERRRLEFETGVPVEPRSASAEAFRFPVSVACAVVTDRLRLDRRDEVFVRGASGAVERVGPHETLDLEAGTYSVDLNAPIKLYLRVEGPLSVSAGADSLEFAFEEANEVLIGGRSYHERPAATITTTDDPEDTMEALSYFASALKTTTCERAFPTLRGHPPDVTLGDHLHVPERLDRPETGVRLIVPPEYDYVYPVASLAFYLGARVIPGSPPRLTTRDGFEYDLTEDGPYEDTVAGVLQQLLFLDCVVRTEGLYRIDLHEREQVEDALPFSPAEAYEWPLREQVARYLEVPYREVEPHLPRWCLTAHVPTRPAGVEALPFVADELGIVRSPRGRRVATPDGDRGDGGGALLDAAARQPYVVPDRTDEAVDHAWFADYLPLGATKAMVQAHKNALDRDQPEGPLDIVVACNDERMARESEALDTVYGFHDDLPYRVESHTMLDRDALREVLCSEADVVHFIGEASRTGLECPDGALDVATLDRVGVELFLLNAPRSADQGVALVEAGAVGGVATLGEVRRDDAATIGRGLARLLNLGFPLGPAVELVEKHARGGDRYLVIGDGTADIAQTSGAPLVCDVARRDDGDYDLSIETYPGRQAARVGTFVSPFIESVDQQFLAPGRMSRVFTLSEAELRSFMDAHAYPLRVDGELRWNDTLDAMDI